MTEKTGESLKTTKQKFSYSSADTADTDTFPVRRNSSKIMASYRNIEFNSDNSISNDQECPEDFKIVSDDGDQPRQKSMAVN